MKINGKTIREEIDKKGIKRNYLIKASGVSRATFYKYVINGFDLPDDPFYYMIVVKIAAALELPLEKMYIE